MKKQEIICKLNDEANNFFRKEQYQKALKKWEEVIKINPNYKCAIHNKACCLWSLGKADEAIKFFDLAFKLKPLTSSPYMKAIILKSQDKFKEALENCNLAEETNDGDMEPDIITDLREEIILAEKYNKMYVKSSQPPSNKEELELFLNWAKSFCKGSGLKLTGCMLYDNEFFSNDYLSKLVKDKQIVLNKDMGKKTEPEKIDLGNLKADVGYFIKKTVAEFNVSPWYYKYQGKIFSSKQNLDSFKKTKQFLSGSTKEKNIGLMLIVGEIMFLN
ncbi:MAG: hypothetical protein AABX04_01005 [Nanoarchaeota archaeon]